MLFVPIVTGTGTAAGKTLVHQTLWWPCPLALSLQCPLLIRCNIMLTAKEKYFEFSPLVAESAVKNGEFGAKRQ